MLRIGKNPSESEQPDKQEGSAYGTAPARTQTPTYQPAEPPAKPSSEGMSSSKALSESETLARDIKEGTLSGFVGSGTVVTGEANFKAMMRVDGHLSGRVSSGSGTLIIGANGKVDANIEVAVAVIHGTINGDIIATQRLELGRAAKVNGNIQTPSLIIEQGAVFEGSCKMAQMSATIDKAKKEKSEQPPLDTSKMPAVSADATKRTEMPSVSSVA